MKVCSRKILVFNHTVVEKYALAQVQKDYQEY